MIRKGCDTSPSLAVGGFSTVWGATILPFVAEDTADWPFPIAELGPHYQAVLSFMDSSTTVDDLAELFPLSGRGGPALRPSRQAEALLRDLRRHRERLGADGIRFGASRLAVRADARGDRPGCAYCGLCMYGCPYGLIYSSADTLPVLAANPRFQHWKGVVVERLEEGNGGVRIVGRRRTDGAPVEYRADRVYPRGGRRRQHPDPAALTRGL